MDNQSKQSSLRATEVDFTSDDYRTMAQTLVERACLDSYYSGSSTCPLQDGEGEYYATLTLTLIVYRSQTTLLVDDVQPVWWECSTMRNDGEAANNFSFNEFRPYLIECCNNEQ